MPVQDRGNEKSKVAGAIGLVFGALFVLVAGLLTMVAKAASAKRKRR